jgi:hypothetical protein
MEQKSRHDDLEWEPLSQGAAHKDSAVRRPWRQPHISSIQLRRTMFFLNSGTDVTASGYTSPK